jgi:hypothetical protein
MAALENALAAPRAAPAGDPSRLVEAIINATHNIVYAKDLQGRYLLVNDRCFAASGFARDLGMEGPPGSSAGSSTSARSSPARSTTSPRRHSRGGPREEAR